MASDMTSQQAAAATGLSVATLRYYERLSLFPTPEIGRLQNGHRRYCPEDILWIGFVVRLRNTGMPLCTIQHFVELARRGDASLTERRQMLEAHLESIEHQIMELEQQRAIIRGKAAHYRALEAKPPFDRSSKTTHPISS